MRKVFNTGFGILLCNFLFSQSTSEYLDRILNRIDEIKTVSYYSKSSSSAPGDTLAFRTYKKFINMYINPVDTFIGASYSISDVNSITKLEYCYDGTYSVRLNWDNRQAQIDTLPNDPKRRPMAPFFIKAKSLLMYTKENIDSSIVKIYNFHDSTKISICINDKVIEFLGLNPFIWELKGGVSKYELILDRNDFPYKIIRKMPHQTSWETCTEIDISNNMNYDFYAIQQIPVDFTINGQENNKLNTIELEEQIAPDWNLKEIYGDHVSLESIKRKVILIQFTGIGCGPCHASIPFLNQLVADYKDKKFELICIETQSKNIAGMERYKDKNELKCKFLVSEKGLKEEYKIQGVPTFFILDKKHVIKKVIVGYQKGETDKEIIGIINKLL